MNLRRTTGGAGRAPWRAALVLISLIGGLWAGGDGTGERESRERVEPPAPARLKVSGCGPLSNRRLRQVLLASQPGMPRPVVFDANFIEDAAVLILASVGEDGYGKPRLRADLVLADGTPVAYVWDGENAPVLPRPLAVKEARLQVERGVRSYYRRIVFEGLVSVPRREAERYFVPVESLVAPRSLRIYTPARLKRSLNSLAQDLRTRGYEGARVEVAALEQDEATGAVDLRVRVTEGMPARVRSVQVQVIAPDAAEPAETRVLRPDVPHSSYWRQDFAAGLRQEQYRRGYPDARVVFVETAREEIAGGMQVDLVARVETGPLVTVGAVEVRGLNHTRPPVALRRLSVEPGETLDRTAAERGRQRLARLGVFSGVGMELETTDDPGVRNVVYEVREGKRIDVNLLFGYGSYELLRGGVELEVNQLWGLAHQLRARAVQSFKSSSGDALYAIPDLVGEETTVFANGSALRREEVNWLREEYGGGAGVRRFVRSLASDIGVRYNYQSLNASEAEEVLPDGVERTQAGAFILDLKHDGRDNPVSPHRGFKLFTTLELASSALGGDVNYQRLEVSASYHVDLRGGRYLHVGVSHGVAWPGGEYGDELPFNKRFFPGGANSIRGYQEGEAGPLNAAGESVGAETVLLGNLEFEQALTPRWSVVGFLDALGFAESIDDYPVDDALYSVGLGIRWNTVIGPARLEYGYNLNPRPADPTGTLHFSLGFPF